jgi:hypothetical protein
VNGSSAGKMHCEKESFKETKCIIIRVKLPAAENGTTQKMLETEK